MCNTRPSITPKPQQANAAAPVPVLAVDDDDDDDNSFDEDESMSSISSQAKTPTPLGTQRSLQQSIAAASNSKLHANNVRALIEEDFLSDEDMESI